jgi:putative ABC transport system substrate-binding protein
MNRREFIVVLDGPAATSTICPLGVNAQHASRRIGVLMGAFTPTNPEGQAALAAFLNTLGWTAGQTAQIDVRWMGDDLERGKGYAAELIALAPDVLFCSSSLATVLLFGSSV